MTTSPAAETEDVPMRNRGYEADSTSASGSRSAEGIRNERSVEEEGDPDGGRGTLPLPESRFFSSSALSMECRRRNGGSSKEVYTCHLCSFVGTTCESFDQHMVDCHYIYRCIECSYSARTQGRLKRHLRDTHRKSATIITGHREAPGRPNPHRPPSIGDQLRKMRRNKTIRCKYCKFITVEKNDFWRHLADHIPPDKQLRCNRCPFVTDLKHHHEYHLRSHEGFKPFLCLKCGYSCVNKSMLNSHSKSHSNVYRFRCAGCSFAAKYSHALKLHILKYGHSAGPVLNQDGSLPVAVGAVPPTQEFPGLRRDRTLAGTQLSGPSERAILLQDRSLSATQVSRHLEQPFLRHGESYPVQVMSEPVERQFPFGSCNFSTTATCSGIPIFHHDGEAISVPVTLGLPGRAVIHHDGNLSISTSSGIALRPGLTEDSNLSLGYTNSRRAVLNDYAGHPSVITVTDHCSKEKRKQRECPIEARKKKPLEGGSSLDPPLNSLGVSFPSLTVQPFQFSPVDLRCAAVSPEENNLDLSALLQRQRRVPPSLPHPPDFSGSDTSQFCPSIVAASRKITTASTKTRPFQTTCDYSTPTSVPSSDPESGFDHEQPLSVPESTGETDAAEMGEFTSVDDTRWDSVEIEKPLDLTNRKGLTAERKETPTPTFWDVLHVDEMTLPSTPPSHQVFSPAAFPSSSSTSPIPYHQKQTAPSYLPQISSYRSPPPLLPLSLTLPRNETRDADRFQLNEKDEVLQSQDPDHSEDGDHQDYPPFEDHESSSSSPVKLEGVDDSGGGRETDPSFEGREFECRHCRMIFQDYVMFSIHSDHHGYLDPFECNMCGEKCEDRIQFFLHISRVAHD